MTSPIMGERSIRPSQFGAVGDGASDDTARLQQMLDVAQQNDGLTVELPPLPFRTTSPLRIYAPVTVRGVRGAAKWNDSDGGTRIVYDGNDAAMVIGGTANSPITSGAYNAVEGVTLSGVRFEPSTDGAAAHGVIIDGSSTRDADRGVARDIVLKDVDFRRFGKAALKRLGNAYHTRLFRCGFRGDPTSTVEPLLYDVEATSNITPNVPKQLFGYDCFFWPYGVGNKAAVVLQESWFFGGHFQGDDGVELGDLCGLSGTYHEGNGTAGTVGIQILGRGCVVRPVKIPKYETLVRIGDGTADEADYFEGHIPLIQSATTGFHVTDGGSRRGTLTYGNVNAVTTEVNDERGLDQANISRVG